MKFCSKCGTQIKEENIFCPKCGNKVKESSPVPISTPVQQLPEQTLYVSSTAAIRGKFERARLISFIAINIGSLIFTVIPLIVFASSFVGANNRMQSAITESLPSNPMFWMWLLVTIAIGVAQSILIKRFKESNFSFLINTEFLTVTNTKVWGNCDRTNFSLNYSEIKRIDTSFISLKDKIIDTTVLTIISSTNYNREYQFYCFEDANVIAQIIRDTKRKFEEEQKL